MEIINASIEDIDDVFNLYRFATELQTEKKMVIWPVFERSLVATEIAENRLWKMVDNDSIACVWSTTFHDPEIWEERNADPAIYIHRIATNPAYRGNNLVGKIVEFTEQYARANKKRFIRLDTVGQNQGLIAHYTKSGFDFLGLFKLKNTAGLPAHYQNASVSLFQREVI